MCCFITCIFRIEIATTKLSVVGLKINLTFVRKMAINLSATETVDLVCDDVFYCEHERKGVQKVYSCHGGTTVEDRELDLLAKAVIFCQLRKLLFFNLRATS